MNLSDISTGTQINIYVQLNESKKICATCHAIGPLDDGLVVTRPFYRKVPLNHLTDFTFSIRDKGNNEYSFICNSIDCMDKYNRKFSLMRGLQGIDMSENRMAERYPIWKRAKAHLEQKDDVSVILYDISMRGISIIVADENVFEIGDELHVSFKEADKTRHLTIEATIVRRFNVENYTALGCKTTNMDPAVMGYIAGLKERYNK